MMIEGAGKSGVDGMSECRVVVAVSTVAAAWTKRKNAAIERDDNRRRWQACYERQSSIHRNEKNQALTHHGESEWPWEW